MDVPARHGLSRFAEISIVILLAASFAGFIGVYLLTSDTALTPSILVGTGLIIIGLAGVAAVFITGGTAQQEPTGTSSSQGPGQQEPAPERDVLMDALSDIIVVVDEADDVPHRDQVIYELERATDALDRGDLETVREAVGSIQNLLAEA